MNSKVALITGGTGYIGSNLARRLVQEDWDVHLVVRANSSLELIEDFKKSITLHVYDGSTLSLIEILSKSTPEIVFHLASLFLAEHQSSDIVRLIESNILYGTQLLEAMKVNQVTKLINTGTSWQHYQNQDYNPVCLYAATKQAFESMIDYYIKAYGFKAITLKLFDTYGPEDPRPKLFNLLKKVESQDTPLDMSPGEQLIDLVYIDDVVNAFLTAYLQLRRIQDSTHELYMVSSGNPIKLKDLVSIYEKVKGVKLKINWGGRPYRSREVMVTWNYGVALPGWRKNVTLEQGLTQI
ncbi:MAG TPA: NAD-dependent epimerase/dehydratase family protein [Bacillota bacterium]|nr:NAD-dependent epimerase/dehydratase family protein [Bacillota bacterium]